MQHQIDPREYDALNRDFYEEHPSGYFRTRVLLLVSLCDPSAPLAEVFAKGVSFANISARTPFPGENELEGFATLEALSILHLASETLLRLTIAHRDDSGCPPIELARLTSFRVFKLAVEQLINMDRAEQLRIARKVFRRSDAREEFPELSDEVWDADGTHLLSVLRLATDHVLKPGPYNSFKHGFGLQPSRPYLKIGSEETPGRVLVEHSGPAVSYLHFTADSASARVWHRTTAFVSLEATLASVEFILKEIDALWTVARVKYLRESGSVDFKHEDLLSQSLRKSAVGGEILQLAMTKTFPPFSPQ